VLPFNMTSDDLISEIAVLARWPALSKSRLRIARHTGLIAWVKGKRGSAWYRPSSVEDFIKRKLEHPCLENAPDHYSSSATTGSPTKKEQKSSTTSGLSPELEELVAQVSVQKIFKKP